DGREYLDLAMVERDFAAMADNGITAVRIPHTMPPRTLLDVAQRHGLRVMVGLSAEQYVGYLIDRRGAPDIEALIRAKVRTCAGHPALLCYALGNEIPAPLARWLGRDRVQRYLERLARVVRDEDPGALVTYVNYPTTADRSPKPALETIREAFADVPFTPKQDWPRVSVVVCTHNGARTIRDCCEGMRRLDYPDLEVIVVDDGSTDATAAIVQEYGFRLIRTANRGLASARNTGFLVASGEIIAYLDDEDRKSVV